MYIRRDCLAQVGLLDVENFGKGYGEENDFYNVPCAGWAICIHSTLLHYTGGVSFGDSKNSRQPQAAQANIALAPP